MLLDRSHDCEKAESAIPLHRQLGPQPDGRRAELGINASAQRSRSVDKFRDTEFDVVVTVCDNAAKNRPIWFGSGKVTHIGFSNPAAATGSEDEQLAVFRRVRDEVCGLVLGYLEEQR